MRPFPVFFIFLAMLNTSLAKDKSEASDFVRQHLNSIGTNEARAAIKNRVVQGTVTFEIPNTTSITWEGLATMVSEGDKLATQLKFPPTVYRTELFVTDGKKTSAAQVKPGSWSEFGTFIRTHTEILTEGLWGGTLSTAWALSNIDNRSPKLEDRGIKKVDGTELHRFDYIPKKNRDDLEIQLYFEPETYRHVMTVYLLTVTAPQGFTPNRSAGRQDTSYRLEERFGDFKTIDNLTLPTSWTIHFNYGPVSGGLMDQYKVAASKIVHNVSVDPRNFEVK
jgi:hypothetical protein